MIIWIEVRHFKAYKWKRFIPIWYEHNFVSYTWENWVWKSSILESLNTFFNNKDWLLTKKEKYADSYICPVFLIPKSLVTRLKNEFEIISEYFWDIDKKDKNNPFFEIRDWLWEEERENNFLIFLWEDINREFQYPFWDKARKDFETYLSTKWIEKFNLKNFIKELKSLYAYVYLPVEIDIESFTKIETEEMQKIFDKALKDEIKDALRDVNLDNNWWLNQKLNNFIEEIEEKLNHEYCYDTWMLRNNKVTKWDLVDKILEVYFQKRFLNRKEEWWINKMVKELSAGEKRQALINLVYAFISRWNERDKLIIIWIDEPENSLHTTICYEQFEKLKLVSNKAQTFITTHWYWFIPIIDKWSVHFLKNQEWEVTFFDKINLYDYSFQTKKIPNDFSLKSTNDLIQSIFYSLKANSPYNWLICEWISDKNYLSYFLEDEIKNKNLRIIAVWWIDLVKKFFRYLALPIEENIDDLSKWKVFCLTDTDSNLFTKDISQNPKLEKVLILKRLTKEMNNVTWLIKFETELKKDSINIEQSLNPIIFKKVMDNLSNDDKFKIEDSNIQNMNWNTTKENLRNFDYLDFFSTEESKTKFSKEYIEKMKKELIQEDYIPSWVKEIKTFFNS